MDDMLKSENSVDYSKNYNCGKPFRSKNNFDRFIPYRPNLDINTAHAKILLPVKTPQKQPEQYKDDESVFYNKLLSGTLDTEEHRILPTIQRNDSGYSSKFNLWLYIFVTLVRFTLLSCIGKLEIVHNSEYIR